MENCNTHLSSEALTPPTLSTKKNLKYEGFKIWKSTTILEKKALRCWQSNPSSFEDIHISTENIRLK